MQVPDKWRVLRNWFGPLANSEDSAALGDGDDLRQITRAAPPGSAGRDNLKASGIFPGMRLLFAVALGSALLPSEAQSRDFPLTIAVDVELVLAVDVSGSMTPAELDLQRKGYAQAFMTREFVQAVHSGSYGRILVSYVEWSGEDEQRLGISWTLIETPEDAESFASRLSVLSEERPRGLSDGTSISGMLMFSDVLFNIRETGHTLRRVIDVSGDGRNNVGPPVLAVRDALVAKGITINGLAIDLRSAEAGRPNQMEPYFEKCVIGGPGAFVEGISNPSQIGPAILRKLLGELTASATSTSWPPPRLAPASWPVTLDPCR